MKDIKVFEDLQNMMDEDNWWFKQKHSPVEFFAEAVARTRQEDKRKGVSIKDIAGCFKVQFDAEELSALIHELNQK